MGVGEKRRSATREESRKIDQIESRHKKIKQVSRPLKKEEGGGKEDEGRRRMREGMIEKEKAIDG